MPSHTTSVAMAAAERRFIVAARYLQGALQSEIAREVGVTQAQISLDLKAVRAAWLHSALRDFDAAKSEQLGKIDLVEYEAWAAWERSKQPREVTVTEQTEGGQRTRKASVRREGQAGDPRYLERIQKCIEQRCTILGVGTAPAPGTVVNVQLNIKTTLTEAFTRAYGHSAALPNGAQEPRDG